MDGHEIVLFCLPRTIPIILPLQLHMVPDLLVVVIGHLVVGVDGQSPLQAPQSFIEVFLREKTVYRVGEGASFGGVDVGVVLIELDAEVEAFDGVGVGTPAQEGQPLVHVLVRPTAILGFPNSVC